MNKMIAKFLYIKSVGWDMSEMPIAAIRDRERQRRYMRRTGSDQECHPTRIEWLFYGLSPWVIAFCLFVAALAYWRP